MKILHGLSAAFLLLVLAGPAVSQGYPPQSYPGQSPYPGQPQNPGQSQANRPPACLRLEAQLAAVDRGNADPGRADQIKRYEEASNKQQFELDRMIAQSRKIGCEGSGFFSLFSNQPAQCGPLNNQIQQMRANLDRILGDLERLQGGNVDRQGQRQAILAALGQNDCGPQYRSASAQPRGFFDTLFGPGSLSGPAEPYQSSTFRTVCVRTCDGFYFPISFSATPGKFADDEKVCQRMCPAAEVALYSHRNPGENMSQAVSLSGRPYTELPTAFHYRQEVNPACSCRRAGQSWSEALKQIDDTVERGDIVVTDERAKQLSKPAAPKPAASKGTATTPAPAAPAAATSGDTSEKKTIRTVGPTFIPAR